MIVAILLISKKLQGDRFKTACCCNCTCFIRQASSKRQHHLNKHLYRPSTFLTSYEPPVYMDEEDERSAYYSSVQDPSADDSVSPRSHHRTLITGSQTAFSLLLLFAHIRTPIYLSWKIIL